MRFAYFPREAVQATRLVRDASTPDGRGRPVMIISVFSRLLDGVLFCLAEFSISVLGPVPLRLLDAVRGRNRSPRVDAIVTFSIIFNSTFLFLVLSFLSARIIHEVQCLSCHQIFASVPWSGVLLMRSVEREGHPRATHLLDPVRPSTKWFVVLWKTDARRRYGLEYFLSVFRVLMSPIARMKRFPF